MRKLREHTGSSLVPDPYNTGSDKLVLMPFCALCCHTPSQFHSPSCLTDDCCASLLADSLPQSILLLLSDELFIRYARQAFQAPGLPAASNGKPSSVSSSSNVCLIYRRTSLMAWCAGAIGATGHCACGGFEEGTAGDGASNTSV